MSLPAGSGVVVRRVHSAAVPDRRPTRRERQVREIGIPNCSMPVRFIGGNRYDVARADANGVSGSVLHIAGSGSDIQCLAGGVMMPVRPGTGLEQDPYCE